MTDRDVIAQLIAARHRVGLLQRDVAQHMHVTPSTVGHIERGTHSPTLATLLRYAAAVDVKLTIQEAS